MSCTGCPYNFWTGDNSSFAQGVFLYCNRIRASLSSSNTRWLENRLINFFMDFTVVSYFPFDCGYAGEDTLCSTPHSSNKVANVWEVNWGPPSRPQNIRHSSARKIFTYHGYNSTSSSVITHKTNRWPVGIATNHNQKMAAINICEINSQLLKWA